MVARCYGCDRPFGPIAIETTTDPDELLDKLTHARADVATYRRGLTIATVLLIALTIALYVVSLLGITAWIWITAVGTAAAGAWLIWWYAVNVGSPRESVWSAVRRLEVAHNKARRDLDT
jgi:hypothetical protein